MLSVYVSVLRSFIYTGLPFSSLLVLSRFETRRVPPSDPPRKVLRDVTCKDELRRGSKIRVETEGESRRPPSSPGVWGLCTTIDDSPGSRTAHVFRRTRS